MVIVKQLQNLEQSYKMDLGFSSAELKLYDDSVNHNIFGMLTIQFAEMCVIIIFHCHNIFRRGTSMEKKSSFRTSKLSEECYKTDSTSLRTFLDFSIKLHWTHLSISLH